MSPKPTYYFACCHIDIKMIKWRHLTYTTLLILFTTAQQKVDSERGVKQRRRRLLSRRPRKRVHCKQWIEKDTLIKPFYGVKYDSRVILNCLLFDFNFGGKMKKLRFIELIDIANGSCSSRRPTCGVF